MANTSETPPAFPSAVPAKPGMSKRWMLIVLALTFLFVLMPFLFWQATWFGRPLADDQIEKAVNDRDHPREIQHALSQIADRILAPDAATRATARPFYPDVVRVAQTGGDELRITAAWVMGQDDAVPEFHTELARLLADPNLMVRRNAALALICFGDDSGRSEIRATLEPYAMPSPQAGVLTERLKPGDAINAGTLVGRIAAGGTKNEFRSLVPGTIHAWLVPDGTTVAAAQPVLLVDPSSAEIWEVLRALYLIGSAADLPLVEPFAQPLPGVPPNIRQQAEITAQAIRARQSQAHGGSTAPAGASAHSP
jgi:hypothetical protein